MFSDLFFPAWSGLISEQSFPVWSGVISEECFPAWSDFRAVFPCVEMPYIALALENDVAVNAPACVSHGDLFTLPCMLN